MRRRAFTLAIPNNNEFSVPQLRVLLREVESALGRAISLNEWSKLYKLPMARVPIAAIAAQACNSWCCGYDTRTSLYGNVVGTKEGD